MATERELLKEPTHYVVFFEVDKTWFQASRKKVLSNSQLVVGNCYQVQWGSAAQSDKGLIVGAGDWISMRGLLLAKQGTVPDQFNAQDPPAVSETNSGAPTAQKRKRAPQTAGPPKKRPAKEKPAARVLRRCPPPPMDTATATTDATATTATATATTEAATATATTEATAATATATATTEAATATATTEATAATATATTDATATATTEATAATATATTEPTATATTEATAATATATTDATAATATATTEATAATATATSEATAATATASSETTAATATATTAATAVTATATTDPATPTANLFRHSLNASTPARPYGAVASPHPTTLVTVLRVIDNLGETIVRKFNEFSSTMTAKMDTLNRRMLATELEVKTMRVIMDRQAAGGSLTPAATDEQPTVTVTVTESTEQLGLPRETLDRLYKESTCAGNLGKKLVELLCPELFGPEMLRTQYSYNGGGPKQKKELNNATKTVVKRCVIHYHPEMNNSTSYQNSVINVINEGLRRQDKKRHARHQPQATTTTALLAEATTTTALLAEATSTTALLAEELCAATELANGHGEGGMPDIDLLATFVGADWV